MKINNILQDIGNTPHIKLNKLFGEKANVWMKLERNNPGGSIKDRIGLSMIEDAEEKGLLNKDSVIIEPTSGNTGVGLAMVAAVKNYKIILVMPESMSMERRRLMSAYGAQFELTPREKGMNGAIERAREMTQETANSWMPMQFDNQANIEAHKQYTAKEILADFPEGLDYLITGVGTGGHITGCAETLKAKFKQLKVIAVEPELSPVISGGNPGPHPLQGIGAGFIPKNLKKDLLDGTIQVGKEEAYTFAARCAREEGILVGISTGASLAAVAKKIPEIPADAKVLTFCYDTGERYLSVEDLFTEV
jgi:cysteine synthase A